MKRLFITAVAIAASTASFAQTGTAQPAAQPIATETSKPATETAAPVSADETRKQIRIEELPAAVRADLNTVQYKGWAPSVAYWVSDNDNKKDWYEITMVSGDESKIVKYNAEGSKLD